mgnify:FL=1
MPKEEGELITRHIREHHVDLRLNTELDEIIDDGNGQVKEIRTKDGEVIPCQIVGLTAGVSPNVEFLRGSNLKVDRGIVVNAYMETNMPDVYAIGDCAQFDNPVDGRRPVEQVWYTGRIMGETVAQNIAGNRKTDFQSRWEGFCR